MGDYSSPTGLHHLRHPGNSPSHIPTVSAPSTGTSDKQHPQPPRPFTPRVTPEEEDSGALEDLPGLNDQGGASLYGHYGGAPPLEQGPLMAPVMPLG